MITQDIVLVINNQLLSRSGKRAEFFSSEAITSKIMSLAISSFLKVPLISNGESGKY